MRVIIIAEGGVNHNGSFELAKKLVLAAKEAGADYIKFQTYITELNISKEAKKANYQNTNAPVEGETQFEMVKKLELSFDSFVELKKYCNEIGIGFLSTGFDKPSIEFLKTLDIDFFKIPSGEITNFPYLKLIAGVKKPVIMSTGMCNVNEIEEAIAVLTKFGLTQNMITVLHCNTEYPTPMEDVNLLAMAMLSKKLGVKTGYSDHTLGIEVPIAAVALGATVIEKHFTADRNLPGPDHKASLEPGELKAMVTAIRNIEKAIGNGIKEPSESETKNIEIARKSIHLNRDISQGAVIREEDLIALRPGDGISAMQWENVIGKKLVNDRNKMHKLSWEDLQ